MGFAIPGGPDAGGCNAGFGQVGDNRLCPFLREQQVGGCFAPVVGMAADLDAYRWVLLQETG